MGHDAGMVSKARAGRSKASMLVEIFHGRQANYGDSGGFSSLLQCEGVSQRRQELIKNANLSRNRIVSIPTWGARLGGFSPRSVKFPTTTVAILGGQPLNLKELALASYLLSSL